MLQGHHHPDEIKKQTNKTENNTKKKKKRERARESQDNVTDEDRWKNSQQNTSIQNSVMHEKDCTLWSSGIYLRDARNLKNNANESVWYIRLTN